MSEFQHPDQKDEEIARLREREAQLTRERDIANTQYEGTFTRAMHAEGEIAGWRQRAEAAEARAEQAEGERDWIKERHGQQADRANAAEARVAELTTVLERTHADQDVAMAYTAELEEALREIENGGWGAKAAHVNYDIAEFARRALAHKEETP